MIEIESNKKKDYQSILTDDAINFLEKICLTFESSRQEILENRKKCNNPFRLGVNSLFQKIKK